jgi:hypothetical protein
MHTQMEIASENIQFRVYPPVWVRRSWGKLTPGR